MYAKQRKKGLQIIAINPYDPPATISKYIKEGKFTFPIVRNGKGGSDAVAKYGVAAFPTNIVVDKNGKVTERFIGYDPKGLAKALAKLGVK